MIRVTGGTFCGRRLKTVRGAGSRPTLSRVREAAFNILGNVLADSTFLDLFAGVGTMGIEALSRGAAGAVFVETDGRCRRVLFENLSTLGLQDRAHVVAMDSIRWLQQVPFAADIVFADPPYNTGLASRVLEVLGKGGSGGVGCVMIQHGPGEVLPDRAGGLSRTRWRSYGDTVLDIYEPTDNDGAE